MTTAGRRRSSALRVCVVGDLSGGVGIYGQNLIRGLVAMGVEVTALTSTPELTPGALAVPVPRHRGWARQIPQALAFARALAPLRHAFDVVHFLASRDAAFVRGGGGPLAGTMNDYFYAITGWLSAAGSRAVYADWWQRHLYYNCLRVLDGRSMRRLDRVLCISRAVHATVRERYVLDARRLPVVPYGIASPPPPDGAVSNDGPVVLFAGGNFQRKGLGVLVRASVAVLARRPDVRFVVVGRSFDRRLIQRLCERLGVGHAFRFVGPVSHAELYRYYRAADIYAMPSLMEAFGLPYLEAMQCGVPVIASDAPGPDDFLLHETNALVAPVRDPGSVADHTLRLLGSPELRAALIDNGRRTAAEFTVERMVGATLAVYRELAGSGTRR